LSNPYNQDWFFYPITVDETNDTIAGYVNQAPFLATIPHGVYYWYVGTFVPGIESMEIAIFQALDQEGYPAPGEETWARANPTESFVQTDSAYDLSPFTDIYPGPTGLDFTPGNGTTADPAWFGYRAELYSVDSQADLDNGTMRPPLTELGIWRANNLAYGANQASDKRSRPVADVKWSTNRIRGRVSNTYFVERLRRYFLEWIPAAHIHPKRALNESYADVAKLALGDTRNGFEGVYEAFRANEPVVIIYDSPVLPDLGAEGEVDPLVYFDGLVEVVAVAKIQAASDFAANYALIRSAGELYNLDLSLIVTTPEGFKAYPW
jgi:hypothetical protein